MLILLLDFDGVLHPEHCHESKHISCLPILEDVLRQVPECKVLIASTWSLDVRDRSAKVLPGRRRHDWGYFLQILRFTGHSERAGGVSAIGRVQCFAPAQRIAASPMGGPG